MIDFMVIALPRSGTAWTANLLTTDDSICLHESFLQFTIDQLDDLHMPHKLGISETAGAFFPEEINKHPAKKLVITRPIHEINSSTQKLDMPELTEHAQSLLDDIDGYRIEYRNLFDYKEMRKAFEFLLDKKLDPMRHALLCGMRVENIEAVNIVRNMF